MTTPNTPIQFSEDDRQLLRQVLGLVQNLDARLSIVEDTQQQMLRMIQNLDARLTVVEERLTTVENKLTVIEERLTTVENKLTVVEERLSIVEDKKYQTTPSLLNAFRHLLEEQLEAQLEAHLKPIKEQLNKLEKEFRYYKTQTRLEIASLCPDLSIVEERVGTLEITNKS
jgi:archaellum component FlaC